MSERLRRAGALVELKRYEEALALYQQESGPTAAYGEGGCLWRLGRYEEAREALERCLALKPDFHEARKMLAALPATTGDALPLAASSASAGEVLGLAAAPQRDASPKAAGSLTAGLPTQLPFTRATPVPWGAVVLLLVVGLGVPLLGGGMMVFAQASGRGGGAPWLVAFLALCCLPFVGAALAAMIRSVYTIGPQMVQFERKFSSLRLSSWEEPLTNYASVRVDLPRLGRPYGITLCHDKGHRRFQVDASDQKVLDMAGKLPVGVVIVKPRHERSVELEKTDMLARADAMLGHYSSLLGLPAIDALSEVPIEGDWLLTRIQAGRVPYPFDAAKEVPPGLHVRRHGAGWLVQTPSLKSRAQVVNVIGSIIQIVILVAILSTAYLLLQRYGDASDRSRDDLTWLAVGAASLAGALFVVSLVFSLYDARLTRVLDIQATRILVGLESRSGTHLVRIIPAHKIRRLTVQGDGNLCVDVVRNLRSKFPMDERQVLARRNSGEIQRLVLGFPKGAAEWVKNVIQAMTAGCEVTAAARDAAAASSLTPEGPIKKFLPLASLVAANAMPLMGVLFWDWTTAEVLALYWVESVVVGIFSAFCLAANGHDFVVMSSGARGTDLSARFINSIGLMVIFGVFIFILGSIVALLIGQHQSGVAGGRFTPTAVLPYAANMAYAVVALVVGYAASFFVDYIGRGERFRFSAKTVWAAPNARIGILLVTLVVGGILERLTGQIIWPLVVLVLLKITGDIWSFRFARKRLAVDI